MAHACHQADRSANRPRRVIGSKKRGTHHAAHSNKRITGLPIGSLFRGEPPDDRRHFVPWSPLGKEDFDPDYWNRLWRWYDAGGYAHVAAYLRSLNLTNFDPKAPPAFMWS
jgi:hypothetical protein